MGPRGSSALVYQDTLPTRVDKIRFEVGARRSLNLIRYSVIYLQKKTHNLSLNLKEP